MAQDVGITWQASPVDVDLTAWQREDRIEALRELASDLARWSVALHGYGEEALARASWELGERALAIGRFHERPTKEI